MCIRDSSTGERQRVQLARSVRNRTTGVLYVLDEPSIGLHPSNIEGLRGVMHDLIADGNSIVLVAHDTEILRDADWLIEMGPGAGENGGTILTQGTVEQVAQKMCIRDSHPAGHPPERLPHSGRDRLPQRHCPHLHGRRGAGQGR